jgi:hypothetical protein
MVLLFQAEKMGASNGIRPLPLLQSVYFGAEGERLRVDSSPGSLDLCWVMMGLATTSVSQDVGSSELKHGEISRFWRVWLYKQA